MEPVTHFLTGACIGRAGLNRLTAYATMAATLAAEAADLDVLWGIRGPVESLAHHRGITHTFLGAPFVALVVTGFIWLLDRGVRKFWIRGKAAADAQPVRWVWIYLTSLIAALSHLALDWTNNYGIRPFFPFNAHWYSGDLVFIAEPVLWGLLLSALAFPALFGLADREVGVRKTRFRGRSWAVASLVGMVVLWCWRWTEQAEARNLVEAAQVTPTPAIRFALEPYPINPYRWHAILETGTTWQVAEVDTRTGTVVSDPHVDALFKSPRTAAVEVARTSRLGQVYLDWSQWPVVRAVESGRSGPSGPAGLPGRSAGEEPSPGLPFPDLPRGQEWSAIEFSDLRFAYSWLDTSMSGRNGSLDYQLVHSPLTGWVYVLDGKEEAGQFLNGREEK